MKTIVIYHSQTGFTRRYAGWIAEALEGDCIELSHFDKRQLKNYDAVVFGSWCKAGSINKIDWVQKNQKNLESKKLAVFCTGASPLHSGNVEVFLKSQQEKKGLEHAGIFYFPGGFCLEKLPISSQMVMKMFIKGLDLKKDKTEEEKQMSEMLKTTYDLSKKEYIEPLLSYIKAD